MTGPCGTRLSGDRHGYQLWERDSWVYTVVGLHAVLSAARTFWFWLRCFNAGYESGRQRGREEMRATSDADTVR